MHILLLLYKTLFGNRALLPVVRFRTVQFHLKYYFFVLGFAFMLALAARMRSSSLSLTSSIMPFSHSTFSFSSFSSYSSCFILFFSIQLSQRMISWSNKLRGQYWLTIPTEGVRNDKVLPEPTKSQSQYTSLGWEITHIA